MKACAFLSLLLGITVFAALCSGAVHIAPWECFGILLRRPGIDGQKAAVLLSIRLPRIVLGCLTGAGVGNLRRGDSGIVSQSAGRPKLDRDFGRRNAGDHRRICCR